MAEVEWPQRLEFLRDSGAWFFGVWGLAPGRDNDCTCSRGTVFTTDGRDHLFSEKGTCPKPGKHPMVYRLPDGLHGFPHGWRDAVTWAEWQEQHAGNVRALGGRLAVAVPSWCWVLDVDSDVAWRGLVRLFKVGAVTFDDVLAVGRTSRGWHVWLQAEHDGWTSGRAQYVLNASLDGARTVRGLEVKSGKGYVLWPDGRERYWVDVRVFAQKVAFSSAVSGGWGSAVARHGLPTDVVRLTSGLPPEDKPLPEARANIRPTPDTWELWTEDERERWLDLPSLLAPLAVQAGGVVTAPEGTRNVRLNTVTWYAGRVAVAAGLGYARVTELLVRAGLAAGLDIRECRATVRSGLRGLEA